MTQEGFQVVAEIYRLLATNDATAIEAASKKPGISRNLRAALTLLHQEAIDMDANGAHNEESRPPSRVVTHPVAQNRLPSDPEKGILGFLLDDSKFPNKQALVHLARRLGLKCDIPARDNRERAARKILRTVAQDKEALKKLMEMASSQRVNQTAGWLDVILGK